MEGGLEWRENRNRGTSWWRLALIVWRELRIRVMATGMESRALGVETFLS